MTWGFDRARDRRGGECQTQHLRAHGAAGGFEGYEDFRAPFREAIRKGAVSFPDRARWLQDIRKSGDLGGLYADMVEGAIRNLEETFAGIDAEALKSAAEAIWASRQVFTLGVGVNNANARNFTYLASTGMVQFHAIPRPGSTPTTIWPGRTNAMC
jgi:DNA-binding MurR/RpiR family transcriptional regulator